MKYKILVVDDEPDVVQLLKDYFEVNGYDVLCAKDGAEALELAKKSPDLILLDINMPKMDGILVCKTIRDYVSCPILFLTAKIEDSDKIMGFSAGGDDYIIKPFSIDELGARVAAHLRREHRNVLSDEEGMKHVQFFGNLTLDYMAKTVSKESEIIPFAKKEFEIIELLSLNAGQVFDKERIYELIWGYEADGDSSVIAEHIRRIRVKLGAKSEEKHLETVWGMGYKWVK